MKRIAVFGGSFNPVHYGHVGVARRVMEENLADEVWLTVSPRNPLKEQSGLLNERLRLELVRLAVADVPGAEASDFEFALPRPSYSWQTLAALTEAYPEASFSLVIGSDNWLLFPKWAHYEEILARYSLIVYPRPGFSVRASSLPDNVRLLDAPLFPWSSTDIRNRLRQGGDVSDMVPPSVAERLGALPFFRE